MIELGILLILYSMPSIAAVSRKHNDTLAIIAMNLLLGWTIIFWIWSLIWSLTGNIYAARRVI